MNATGQTIFGNFTVLNLDPTTVLILQSFCIIQICRSKHSNLKQTNILTKTNPHEFIITENNLFKSFMCDKNREEITLPSHGNCIISHYTYIHTHTPVCPSADFCPQLATVSRSRCRSHQPAQPPWWSHSRQTQSAGKQTAGFKTDQYQCH